MQCLYNELFTSWSLCAILSRKSWWAKSRKYFIFNLSKTYAADLITSLSYRQRKPYEQTPLWQRMLFHAPAGSKQPHETPGASPAQYHNPSVWESIRIYYPRLDVLWLTHWSFGAFFSSWPGRTWQTRFTWEVRQLDQKIKRLNV